jgi:hypothetical protein
VEVRHFGLNERSRAGAEIVDQPVLHLDNLDRRLAESLVLQDLPRQIGMVPGVEPEHGLGKQHQSEQREDLA